ncbi:MAG: aldo/keto reductase [Proteobacteria bacterium]|nr:aldo/keto reductase [Pseudomonadota bacterium]
MDLRQLGNSDLHISPIILGAWAMGGWYWGGKNDEASIKAIHAALDHGINSIDTAPVYGQGHSEYIVGKALKKKRQDVVLMTKVGLRWDKSEGAHFFDIEDNTGKTEIFRNLRPESIKLEVEQSLQRLQTDYIDLLQCHWPDPSCEVEDSMEALKQLVTEGKVRAVGVSNFEVPLLKRSVKTLSPLPLASNQPHYSLLRRKLERSILPYLQENNIGCIVYSPLAQGLLTGTVSPDRTFPEDDGRCGDPAFSKENRVAVLKALESLKSITAKHNCSFAQLSAAWCFHKPGITGAIVGIRTVEQAKENAAAGEVQLSSADLKTIETAFSHLTRH